MTNLGLSVLMAYSINLVAKMEASQTVVHKLMSKVKGVTCFKNKTFKIYSKLYHFLRKLE